MWTLWIFGSPGAKIALAESQEMAPRCRRAEAAEPDTGRMLASRPMPSPVSLPAHLTLLIPGLLWPRPALDDIVRGLRLPALERLLRFGTRCRLPLPDEGAWWCEAFAAGDPPLPAAPLRLHAAGMEAGDREWACLDPAHLGFEPQQAMLADPAGLDLSAAEDAQLQALVAPIVAPLGDLAATRPGHWHIAPRLPLPPMPATIGDDGPPVALIPQGEIGRPWRQALNEAQMALHAHPINRAREAAGKPTVNTLVLWGAGRLPAPKRRPADLLLATDAAVHGLALRAGCRTGAVPDGFGALDGAGTASTLVRIDALAAPARRHDALAWNTALHAVERCWLAPATDAVEHGRTKSLEAIGFGAGGCLRLRYGRRDRLRFWRAPAALTELHP